MSYTYANRKRADKTAPGKETAPQKPSAEALRSGAAAPTAEQTGHRVDLPDVMRAKMENAFGADLSAVKLYESQAVADAGAKAVTRGSSIAFAPGMLDFSSYGGQALLGHEMSHVVSQARGEVAGGGFVNDSALEARADREGAMAAAGQQVAMPTASLSSVSAAPAAGPMQAKKDPKKQAAAQQAAAPASTSKAVSGLSGLAGGGAKTATDAAKGLNQPVEDDPDEEHEAIDNAYNGLDTGGEKLSGQFEDLEEAKKKGENTTFGKALDKMGIGDDARTGINAFGESTGAAAGAMKGVMDSGKGYQDLEAAKKSGSKSDAANARFDIAKGRVATAGKAASWGKTFSGAFTTGAAEVAKKALGGISTGADIAGEAIDTAKSGYNAVESGIRRHRMGKSLEALEKKENKTAEEKRMEQITRQGKGAANVDLIQNSVDTAANAIGLGGKIATATGTPVGAAVGTGLGFAKTGVQKIGGMVVDYEKDKLQGSTVDEELDTKGNIQKMRNDDRYKAFMHSMSDEDLRKGQLRSEGYLSATDEEAFQDITDKRAGETVDMARRGVGAAQQFTSDAGVNYEKENAKEAVRKKLGVAKMKKKEEFKDANQLNYNAFQQAADDKAASDARTMKEGFQYYTGKWKKAAKDNVMATGQRVIDSAKGFGQSVAKGAKAVGGGIAKAGRGAINFMVDPLTRQAAMEKMKTGAGNAAKAVGKGFSKAGQGIWNGLKGAGTFVKDFATSADKRKETFANMKSGAANAAKAVGKGIVGAGKYAGNVIAHAAKKTGGNIKEWYQNGVDQMNLHKDTYDQMGFGAKAAWTLKNLPARMFHGTKKNKLGTYERTVHQMNIDEMSADMKKRRDAGEV